MTLQQIAWHLSDQQISLGSAPIGFYLLRPPGQGPPLPCMTRHALLGKCRTGP